MTIDLFAYREGLRASVRTWPFLLGMAAGLAAFSAFLATQFDAVVAAGLAGGLVLVVLSLRWPLLPLFVFAALVPVEEAVNIGGLGTLSRLSGILFALVYGVPRLGQLKLRVMPLAGWAYLGWALLSVTWALDPSTAFEELKTLLQLFVVAVLVADVVVHDPTVIRPLLWVYSVSAALTACLGIGTYLAGVSISDERVAALPNQDQAQFAALLLPALVFTLNELLHNRHRIAAGSIALLTTAGIILSGTRGAWVSAVVVVALLLVPRLGLRRGLAAIAVVLALLVLTFQIPGVGDLVSRRTELAIVTGGAGRTDIWAVGARIIESSPVVGVGFANFPVAFTTTMMAAADVGVGIGTGRGPHNIVVGTTGELGLIGLALLVLFLVPLVLRRGWGPDATVVQAILLALMVDAFFLDVLSNRKQVWLAIGLAAGLAYLRDRSRAPETAREGAAGPRAPTSAAGSAAPALVPSTIASIPGPAPGHQA